MVKEAREPLAEIIAVLIRGDEFRKAKSRAMNLKFLKGKTEDAGKKHSKEKWEIQH